MSTSRTNNIFCLALCVSFLTADAQKRKFVNPAELLKPPGYSHVVVAGGTVYVSGQVPADENGQVVGKGDLRAQVTRVYENLKICLASVGLTFSDVVKMNSYVVDYKPEDITVIREVRKAYLSQENPPASTLVGVSSLVNPDYLIEIELIARQKQ